MQKDIIAVDCILWCCRFKHIVLIYLNNVNLVNDWAYMYVSEYMLYGFLVQAMFPEGFPFHQFSFVQE